MNTFDSTVSFDDWGLRKKIEVANGHDLELIVLRKNKFDAKCHEVAQIIPDHYMSSELIACCFDKLGKEKTAAFLRSKLPKSSNIRSGDLAEILASEFIDRNLPYKVAIKRLRWKDHRDMPMRGDDVIAIMTSKESEPIKFLKSEVKSRARLSKAVIKEARNTLDNNDGLPSPYTLTFISERLFETGKEYLADRIISTQLNKRISKQHVEHLLFTLSGNAPRKFLQTELNTYDGPIRQKAIGLQISKHQQFISEVFKKVDVGDEP